jgi:hypothetical protein
MCTPPRSTRAAKKGYDALPKKLTSWLDEGRVLPRALPKNDKPLIAQNWRT